LPVPVTQVRRAVDSNGASPGSGAAAGGDARKGGRMALSNWRVRWRLFAIITVPTVTALILGVIQNVNANANYNNFARSQELAKLGGWASTAVSRWRTSATITLATSRKGATTAHWPAR